MDLKYGVRSESVSYLDLNLVIDTTQDVDVSVFSPLADVPSAVHEGSSETIISGRSGT